MCNKGRRQSPINIEPEKLLFDPYLRPLHIDKHKVVSAMKIILFNTYRLFLDDEAMHE